MENAEIAAVLGKMAVLLEVKGEIRFKIQAYDKAAQLIAGLDKPLKEMYAASGTKGLQTLAGIGEGIARKIEELLTTGRCKEYHALQAALPPGIEALLELPALGPKTAVKLARELKIRSVADLERAIQEHRVQTLPGMGAKQEANLLKGIALWKQGQERIALGKALPLALEILGILEGLPAVQRATYAGSLRRMRETVGDLDFLATPRRPRDAEAIMNAFISLPQTAEVLVQGQTKSSIRLRNGIQADLRVVEAESFGAALHYFTGSKTHNIQIRELGVRRKLKINEYGVFKGRRRVGGREEEDVFRAVGLPLIPPEIREGTGEVEAAAQGRLPRLIAPGDLKGDLHSHSTWSDGAHSIEQMAAAAQALGYRYLAMCDHSRSLKMAGGLSIEALRKKNKTIDAINKRLKGLRVLKGAEVDILEDGSLDYPDSVLAELDVVVISVHSKFNLSEAAQTTRVARALANKHVSLLAHPTGRLIGKRNPYAINLAEVIKAARDHGKCLELNAQIERLDLADAPLRQAKEAGVTIVINSDSHRADQLALGRQFGVAQARRGWLEAGDVLNTLPLDKLLQRLASRSGS